LDIIFQDDDLLVLNKPSGLLSVPGRLVEHKDSLTNRVQEQFPEARVVHRLDMETSGIMLMALNHPAQKNINLQFEKRQVDKTYFARVHGVIPDDTGMIDAPLICDWPNRPRQIVDFENGKPSQTKWQVIQRGDNFTRVKLSPITGRSHQLRVHLQYIGYPILGDPLYATGAARHSVERLQLHATDITFTHPTSGQPITIESTVPF